jgi:hypothetical protein
MPSNNVVKTVQRYHPEVTKVVDARKDVTIKVTDEDCHMSESKAPNECAMATAFKRTYDGAIISVSSAYLIKGTTAYRYTVPPAVAREIVTFDRYHDFSPGTYHLKAPPPSAKLGSLSPHFLNGGHSRKLKRRQHKTTGIRQL